MHTKKLNVKKALAAALACSMIAGTGVASISASAKIGDRAAVIVSKITEKTSAFKTWLKETVKSNFDAEKAKEITAKLTDKVLEMIPEETREKLVATVQKLIEEQFPKEIIRQLVSEFADTAYKFVEGFTQTALKGLNALYSYAEQAYMKLPEEFRAKVDEALNAINALIDAVKEKAEKYSIIDGLDGFVFLTEGDFSYQISLSAFDGVRVSVCQYKGEETTITIPAKADIFNVTDVFMSAEAPVKTVYLPETIKNINGTSFASAPTVKFVYVNKDNPDFKSEKGVVYDKSGEKLVIVPPARNSFTIPETVSTIGALSFTLVRMKSIEIPETVTFIEPEAFNYALGLESVTIPASIDVIGPATFASCPALTKVVVPSSVKFIADNAFEGISEDAVFYCESATDFAVAYAEKHGFAVSAPLCAEFDAPSYVLLGGSATFTVNAKYGAGDYAYTYSVRPVGTEKWTNLKVNYESNTFTYTPAKPGDYEVCMKVKDADGTIVKTYTTMKVGQTKNNISKISADTVEAGSTVTVNCRAITPKTQFAVYYKEASAETWKTAQKYDANKTVDITFDEAGEYEICVKAKGPFDFISKKYFTVTVE